MSEAGEHWAHPVEAGNRTNEAIVALGVLDALLILKSKRAASSVAPSVIPEADRDGMHVSTSVQHTCAQKGWHTWIIQRVDATDCVKQKHTCAWQSTHQ